jgi:hypothetical protein
MQARYTSFWGAWQLEALESIMGLVTGKHRRAFIPKPEVALAIQGTPSPREAA